MVCVELVIGSKMCNFISFSHLAINTTEVDPLPDSLDNGIVKPKNKPFKFTPKYPTRIKYCLKSFQPVLKSETLTVCAVMGAY